MSNGVWTFGSEDINTHAPQLSSREVRPQGRDRGFKTADRLPVLLVIATKMVFVISAPSHPSHDCADVRSLV